MADTDIVQVIAEARIDAQSLSEFVFKPAGFMVTRRLAPPINTLQFYIDWFDATVATIPTIVNDAINNTAVEGGILADTFVTATAKSLGGVARTQRDKNADTVSVVDFGTKGDGVADDTAAIQKALDYIDNLGGGVVTLPRGTYKTTYTLLVGNNTHFKGEGNPVIMSAPSMAITTKNVLTGSVFKNVHYSGIELTTCDNGFGLFHVDNGSIINCSSSDISYHLTDIAGCTQVLVSQCTSVGNYTSSAYQVDGTNSVNAHNISLPDGSVYYSAEYGRVSSHIYLVFNTCKNAVTAVEIHKTGVEHVYIDRNLFSTDGVITTAKGVDINYNIISKHIYITNNIFKGRFASGSIAVGRNTSYITITGNTFEAEESGLVYCRGVVWDGASAAGNYYNISNNRFIHITQPIQATNANDMEIRNNIIVGASKVGSFIDEEFSYTNARDAALFAITFGGTASRINIVDNIFVDTPHSCIRMSYGTNAVYADVTVSGNRTINSGKLLHIKGSPSGKTERLRVTNNILGYSVYQYYPIDITNVFDVWISDNVIEAHALYALTITGCDNVRVSGNIADLASYTRGTSGSPYTLTSVTNLDFYDNKTTNQDVGEYWLSILSTSTGKIKFDGDYPNIAVTTASIKADFSATEAPTTPRFADGSVAVAIDGGTDTYAWVRASGTWKPLNYAV